MKARADHVSEASQNQL